MNKTLGGNLSARHQLQAIFLFPQGDHSSDTLYLIKFFCHLADDLSILHVTEHLNPYSS